ncbi:hypothetical protein [Psychroserpens sp. SPM9]|uniref:hypothetical protein n=1 Tax=Psychroserpens sp. SPM9 TaxID=2975598 RepID=UPI0021A52254|nr:hypothetical protein [Psychroserpens sp. SPM9]MDG5490440.1 hypothetical protein [Psychroserpens sp. SPM9]
MTPLILLLQEVNTYTTENFDSTFATLGIIQLLLFIIPLVLGVWLFIKVITFLNLKIKLMRRELNQ